MFFLDVYEDGKKSILCARDCSMCTFDGANNIYEIDLLILNLLGNERSCFVGLRMIICILSQGLEAIITEDEGS